MSQPVSSSPATRADPALSLRSGVLVGVGAWRRQRLIEAGFPVDLAGELAGDPALALHEILQLIDRGCPPELAARIEAPLSAEVRP